MIREACVGSYSEASRAVELGADRIELCDNLKDDGTTPSYGTIKRAKETLDTNISVIIRPRGGNFTYSEEEIRIMEEDIKLCESLKVDGIVIGILKEDKKIDTNTVKRLMELAGEMDVTFHMAFDEIQDELEALEELIDLGVDRLLTKGGSGKAFDNIDSLKKLVENSESRITILAGGGVREDNYMELAKKTGVSQLHGSKIVGKLS